MLKRWLAQGRAVSWADLRGDLFGGLTAAVVALPLALAVGAMTHVGAAAGLYGAVFTGIIAALFGGTATQITGPTLTTMAVVLTAFAAGGWAELVLATLFCGLFQILFGVLKMGRLITYIPQPVIAGFTNGMAVFIFAKQLPTFAAAPLIGLVAVLLMWGWPRINRVIPGSLVALVLTAGLAALLGWTEAPYGIWQPAAVIGEIPRGLPHFYWPELNMAVVRPALIAGFTLALIASMESLLSSIIVDDMTGARHRLDKELVGQGIGNIVAAFFRGLVGNGAIVRSVVNTRSGGRTRLSGVIHGVAILAITLSFGGLAERVPMATLAGILMMTAAGMIDWQSVRDLRREHPTDAAVMLVTAVLTFTMPLTFAIGAGVVLSAVLFTMRMSQSRVHATEVEPDLTVISVDGPLFFGDANLLQEKVEDCTGSVVLDLSRMTVVDATGACTLRRLVRKGREQGRWLVLCGLHEGPRATLAAFGFLDEVVACPDLAAALAAGRTRREREALPAGPIGAEALV